MNTNDAKGDQPSMPSNAVRGTEVAEAAEVTEAAKSAKSTKSTKGSKGAAEEALAKLATVILAQDGVLSLAPPRAIALRRALASEPSVKVRDGAVEVAIGVGVDAGVGAQPVAARVGQVANAWAAEYHGDLRATVTVRVVALELTLLGR